VYIVRTFKAKQRFRYVESDEIRDVTPTTHNCDQTQRKALNIKSDISVNVDVFNRRFVTQFPKVALDYDFDLSRYCPTREFYSDLHFLETVLIMFKIHICFILDQTLRTVSFPCWDTSLSVITYFGVIL
jgi:hypothetical protein